MEARIGSHDAPEGGACFRFSVPLREATEDVVAPSAAGVLDVLLVEDEVVSQRLIAIRN